MELKYPDKQIGIICTIGPSSWDPAVMGQMIANGMTVARVNGAFADRAELLKVEELVRAHSQDVELMVDIKGPEVRLNKFPAPKPLQAGEEFEIGSSADFPIYPANYLETYQKMQVGQIIMVGDGDVRLEVTAVKEKSFMVKVVYGHLLKPGKALNFPGAQLNDNPLTEKDIDLATYTIERGWKYISASFIRTKKDAQFIVDYFKLGEPGQRKVQLVAKIEDQSGVDNVEEILEVVDVVMVARGGLGVDMGLEKVPFAQLKLVKASKAANKPVIVATQMLESMIENPLPTRAESNDVATAILQGADYVMLSGESSAGKYPAEAVEFMSKVEAESRKQK